MHERLIRSVTAAICGDENPQMHEIDMLEPLIPGGNDAKYRTFEPMTYPDILDHSEHPYDYDVRMGNLFHRVVDKIANIQDEIKDEYKYLKEMSNKLHLINNFLFLPDKQNIAKIEKAFSGSSFLQILNNYPQAGSLNDINKIKQGIQRNIQLSIKKLKRFQQIYPSYIAENKPKNENESYAYRSLLVKNRLL